MRIISIVLIAAFVAQDIAWANPDLFDASRSRAAQDKLAPETFFNKDGSRELAAPTLIARLIENHPKFQSDISLIAIDHILRLPEFESFLGGNSMLYESEKDKQGQISEVRIRFPGYVLRYYDPKNEANIDRTDKYADRQVDQPKEINERLHKQVIRVMELAEGPGVKGEASKVKIKNNGKIHDSEGFNPTDWQWYLNEKSMDKNEFSMLLSGLQKLIVQNKIPHEALKYPILILNGSYSILLKMNAVEVLEKFALQNDVEAGDLEEVLAALNIASSVTGDKNADVRSKAEDAISRINEKYGQRLKTTSQQRVLEALRHILSDHNKLILAGIGLGLLTGCSPSDESHSLLPLLPVAAVVILMAYLLWKAGGVIIDLVRYRNGIRNYEDMLTEAQAIFRRPTLAQLVDQTKPLYNLPHLAREDLESLIVIGPVHKARRFYEAATPSLRAEMDKELEIFLSFYITRGDLANALRIVSRFPNRINLEKFLKFLNSIMTNDDEHAAFIREDLPEDLFTEGLEPYEINGLIGLLELYINRKFKYLSDGESERRARYVLNKIRLSEGTILKLVESQCEIGAVQLEQALALTHAEISPKLAEALLNEHLRYMAESHYYFPYVRDKIEDLISEEAKEDTVFIALLTHLDIFAKLKDPGISRWAHSLRRTMAVRRNGFPAQKTNYPGQKINIAILKRIRDLIRPDASVFAEEHEFDISRRLYSGLDSDDLLNLYFMKLHGQLSLYGLELYHNAIRRGSSSMDKETRKTARKLQQAEEALEKINVRRGLSSGLAVIGIGDVINKHSGIDTTILSYAQPDILLSASIILPITVSLVIAAALAGGVIFWLRMKNKSEEKESETSSDSPAVNPQSFARERPAPAANPNILKGYTSQRIVNKKEVPAALRKYTEELAGMRPVADQQIKSLIDRGSQVLRAILSKMYLDLLLKTNEIKAEFISSAAVRANITNSAIVAECMAKALALTRENNAVRQEDADKYLRDTLSIFIQTELSDISEIRAAINVADDPRARFEADMKKLKKILSITLAAAGAGITMSLLLSLFEPASVVKTFVTVFTTVGAVLNTGGASKEQTSKTRADISAPGVNWKDENTWPHFICVTIQGKLHLICRAKGHPNQNPYFEVTLIKNNSALIGDDLVQYIPGLAVSLEFTLNAYGTNMLSKAFLTYNDSPNEIPIKDDPSALVNKLNDIVIKCAADRIARPEKGLPKKEEPEKKTAPAPAPETPVEKPHSVIASEANARLRNDDSDAISEQPPEVPAAGPNAWMEPLFKTGELTAETAAANNELAFNSLSSTYAALDIKEKELPFSNHTGASLRMIDMFGVIKGYLEKIPKAIREYLASEAHIRFITPEEIVKAEEKFALLWPPKDSSASRKEFGDGSGAMTYGGATGNEPPQDPAGKEKGVRHFFRLSFNLIKRFFVWVFTPLDSEILKEILSLTTGGVSNEQRLGSAPEVPKIEKMALTVSPIVISADMQKEIIMETVQQAKKQFVYGWADDLRADDSQIMIDRLPGNKIFLMLWRPSLKGSDCFSISSWVAEQLTAKGIPAHTELGMSSQWITDCVAKTDRDGIIVSATPGVQTISGIAGIPVDGMKTEPMPLSPPLSLEGSRGLIRRRQKRGINVLDIVPMAAYTCEKGIVLVGGGIGIKQQDKGEVPISEFYLAAVYIQGEEVKDIYEVTVAIPMAKSDIIQKDLASVKPIDVLEYLETVKEKYGLTISKTSNPQLVNLHHFASENIDLIYHFIAKLKSLRYIQPSATQSPAKEQAITAEPPAAKGGIWPWMKWFYKESSVWKPVMVESIVFMAGGTVLAAYLLGAPFIVTGWPIIGIAAGMFLVWHLLHIDPNKLINAPFGTFRNNIAGQLKIAFSKDKYVTSSSSLIFLFIIKYIGAYNYPGGLSSLAPYLVLLLSVTLPHYMVNLRAKPDTYVSDDSKDTAWRIEKYRKQELVKMAMRLAAIIPGGRKDPRFVESLIDGCKRNNILDPHRLASGIAVTVEFNPEPFIERLPEKMRPRKIPLSLRFTYYEDPKSGELIGQSLTVIYGDKDLPRMNAALGPVDIFYLPQEKNPLLETSKKSCAFDDKCQGISLFNGACTRVLVSESKSKDRFLNEMIASHVLLGALGQDTIFAPGIKLAPKTMNMLDSQARRTAKYAGIKLSLPPIVGIYPEFGGTKTMGIGPIEAYKMMTEHEEFLNEIFNGIAPEDIRSGIVGYNNIYASSLIRVKFEDKVMARRELKRSKDPSTPPVDTDTVGMDLIGVIGRYDIDHPALVAELAAPKPLRHSLLILINSYIEDGKMPLKELFANDEVMKRHYEDGARLARLEDPKNSLVLKGSNILFLTGWPHSFDKNYAAALDPKVTRLVIECSEYAADLEARRIMREKGIVFLQASTANIGNAYAWWQEALYIMQKGKHKYSTYEHISGGITGRTMASLWLLWKEYEKRGKNDTGELSEITNRENNRFDGEFNKKIKLIHEIAGELDKAEDDEKIKLIFSGIKNGLHIVRQETVSDSQAARIVCIRNLETYMTKSKLPYAVAVRLAAFEWVYKEVTPRKVIRELRDILKKEISGKGSTDLYERIVAVYLLGQTEHPEEEQKEVIDLLRWALFKDTDSRVRAEAAKALGHLNDSRAVEPLKNKLLQMEDLNIFVRIWTLWALDRYNPSWDREIAGYKRSLAEDRPMIILAWCSLRLKQIAMKFGIKVNYGKIDFQGIFDKYAKSLYYLGNIYYQMRHRGRALRYYKSAIRNYRLAEIRGQALPFTLELVIAELYFEMEKLQEARESLFRVISLVQRTRLGSYKLTAKDDPGTMELGRESALVYGIESRKDAIKKIFRMMGARTEASDIMGGTFSDYLKNREEREDKLFTQPVSTFQDLRSAADKILDDFNDSTHGQSLASNEIYMKNKSYILLLLLSAAGIHMEHPRIDMAIMKKVRSFKDPLLGFSAWGGLLNKEEKEYLKYLSGRAGFGSTEKNAGRLFDKFTILSLLKLTFIGLGMGIISTVLGGSWEGILLFPLLGAFIDIFNWNKEKIYKTDSDDRPDKSVGPGTPSRNQGPDRGDEYEPEPDLSSDLKTSPSSISKHLEAATQAIRWFLVNEPVKEIGIDNLSRKMTEQGHPVERLALWLWLERYKKSREVARLLAEIESTKRIKRIWFLAAIVPKLTEPMIRALLDISPASWSHWKERNKFNLEEYLRRHPITMKEKQIAGASEFAVFIRWKLNRILKVTAEEAITQEINRSPAPFIKIRIFSGKILWLEEHLRAISKGRRRTKQILKKAALVAKIKEIEKGSFEVVWNSTAAGDFNTVRALFFSLGLPEECTDKSYIDDLYDGMKIRLEFKKDREDALAEEDAVSPSGVSPRDEFGDGPGAMTRGGATGDSEPQEPKIAAVPPPSASAPETETGKQEPLSEPIEKVPPAESSQKIETPDSKFTPPDSLLSSDMAGAKAQARKIESSPLPIRNIHITHIQLGYKDVVDEWLLDNPQEHLLRLDKDPIGQVWFDKLHPLTVALAYNVACLNTAKGTISALVLSELDENAQRPLRNWVVVDDRGNFILLTHQKHSTLPADFMMTDADYEQFARHTYAFKPTDDGIIVSAEEPFRLVLLGHEWIEFSRLMIQKKVRSETSPEEKTTSGKSSHAETEGGNVSQKASAQDKTKTGSNSDEKVPGAFVKVRYYEKSFDIMLPDDIQFPVSLEKLLLIAEEREKSLEGIVRAVKEDKVAIFVSGVEYGLGGIVHAEDEIAIADTVSQASAANETEAVSSTDLKAPSDAAPAPNLQPTAYSLQLIKSIHDLTMAGKETRPIPQNARILLSETLFDEVDRAHLRGLLGENSPVKIIPPREIRNASMNIHKTKQNLACVITKEDYDDPELWNNNNKANIKATLLILGEDMRDSRYLYLGGVVGLARAMMNAETAKDSIEKYVKFMFSKSQDISDTELLELLLKDPRKFANYIKFKTEPFDNDELYEQRKIDMESYLIAV